MIDRIARQMYVTGSNARIRLTEQDSRRRTFLRVGLETELDELVRLRLLFQLVGNRRAFLREQLVLNVNSIVGRTRDVRPRQLREHRVGRSRLARAHAAHLAREHFDDGTAKCPYVRRIHILRLGRLEV